MGISFDVVYKVHGPALKPAFDGITPQSHLSNMTEIVSLSAYKTVAGMKYTSVSE